MLTQDITDSKSYLVCTDCGEPVSTRQVGLYGKHECHACKLAWLDRDGALGRPTKYVHIQAHASQMLAHTVEAAQPIQVSTLPSITNLMGGTNDQDTYTHVFEHGDYEVVITFVSPGVPADRLRMAFARRGVTITHPVQLRGGKTKMVTDKVCGAPIRVVGLVSDIETGKKALTVEYQPIGEDSLVKATYFFDDIMVDRQTEGKAWREMRARGLSIGDYRLVRKYLQLATETILPSEVTRGTSRPGWVNDYRDYIVPGYRTPTAPEYIGSVSANGVWQQCGDASAYVAKVTGLLADNPAPAYIAGYLVGGSLVRLVGAENFILGVIGKTSLGKTLACKLALSMSGAPSDYLTFADTANSLRSSLIAGNDRSIVIDEVGQSGMRPDERAKFIYDVSSGKERGRLVKVNGDYTNDNLATAKYTVILTGEEPLLGAVRQGTAGAAVRYTEMVFSPSSPVWEDMDKPRARELEKFLAENHGWIMPQVIEYIINHKDDITDNYNNMLANLEAEVGDNADNAVYRKLKVAALAATGCAVLAEVLDEPRIFAGGWDMALRLAHEMDDMADSVDDNESYANFLQSLPDGERKIFNRLGMDGRPADENPAGCYFVSNGLLTIRILPDKLDRICDRHGIPSARLLKWGVETGYLTTQKNQDREPRKAVRRAISDTGPRLVVNVHEFVLPVATDTCDGTDS